MSPLSVVELVIVKAVFAIYVLSVTGHFIKIYIQREKDNDFMSHKIDLAAHAAFLLVLSRLISFLPEHESNKQGVNIISELSLSYLAILVMIGGVLGAFIMGLSVGRHTPQRTREYKAALLAGETPKLLQTRKIKLKSKSDHCNSASNSSDAVNQLDSSTASYVRASVESQMGIGDESQAASNLSTQESANTNDATGGATLNTLSTGLASGYEDVIEKAKMTVISIIGLPGSDDSYLNRPWALVRSVSSSHLWVSRAKCDGVLLRGSSFVTCHPTTILNWIIENDLLTGIEGIMHRCDVLKTFYGRNITVRRVSCRSGSMTSSKREFTVATNQTILSDGTLVVSSRSIDAEEAFIDGDVSKVRKTKSKFVRGVVFGSGYVLRRIKTEEGVGCEIFYAAHVDMLGSSTGRMNRLKTDALAVFVLNMMENIQKLASGSSSTDYSGFASNAIPIAATLSAGSLSAAGSSNNQLSTLIRTDSPSPSRESCHDAPPPVPEIAIDSSVCAQIGLSAGQVFELLSLAKGASTRLRLLHRSHAQSAGSKSRSNSLVIEQGALMSNNLGEKLAVDDGSDWNTFYNHEGISVSELREPGRHVGTLGAFCRTTSPPDLVRKLLVEHPDMVDGLLIGRSVLNRLSPQTYVQWLAYGAIWPIGARDFLLVTTEEPYGSSCEDGFVIVSTSIDDVCEEVNDEEEGADLNDGNNFTRSNLRLAGYVGVRNATGGTDVSVFVDVDVYSYIPSWLVQVLAQSGLSEMMGRIQRACSGNAESPGRLHGANHFITTIPSRDALTSLTALLHADPPRHSVAASGPPASEKRRSISWDGSLDTPGAADLQDLPVHVTDNSCLTTRRIRSGNVSRRCMTTSQSKSPFNGSSERAQEGAANLSEDTSGTGTGWDARVTAGRRLSQIAVDMFQVYVGRKVVAGVELGLDWAVKGSQTGVTVEASAVCGSNWNAVRARGVINGSKEDILKLLTDDNRIGEFDDMFDFCQFLLNVDERTNIRRVSFKAIWPTAPRDFVVLTTWTELNDGALLVASRSAPDELSPVEKGYVRGNICVSGYLIQPAECLPGDLRPGQCLLTLNAHTELGGTLPSSIINMLSTSAPMKIVQAIQQIVGRNKK